MQFSNKTITALLNGNRTGKEAVWIQGIKYPVLRAANASIITYNPGANGTGTEQSDNKIEKQALTLKGAIFTRNGYKQSGWATSDGGEKAYELNASYTTDNDITLYPEWEAETYTISYELNGGTINGNYFTSYTYGVGATLPTTVTYDEYDFQYWYETGAENIPIIAIGQTEYGNKTFYAKWEKHQHTFDTTLSYDANDHWYASTCGHDNAVEKVSHSGGTATCTTKVVCTVYQQSYGTYGAHNYGTLVSEKKAVHEQDKLEAGVAVHYRCSVCKKYFDTNQQETTLADLTGTMPQHTYGKWVSTDATNHWKACSCGKNNGCRCTRLRQ